MIKNMNFTAERSVATNAWIIKIRWFYMFGVLLIGFLTKTISQSNVGFSFGAMVALFLTYALINLLLRMVQRRLENNFSAGLLSFLSNSQIVLELIFFTIIMHLAGGIESIAPVFYFLVVVMASLLFGSAGAIMVAIISSALLNWLIIAEYNGLIAHVPRYNVPTLEFSSLSIALTKTIAISIFYLIVGLFTGFGASLLFKRETAFNEKTCLLDDQAKQLVRREKELISANRRLDGKVAELERFQRQAVGRELKMIELKNKIKELAGSRPAEKL